MATSAMARADGTGRRAACACTHAADRSAPTAARSGQIGPGGCRRRCCRCARAAVDVNNVKWGVALRERVAGAHAVRAGEACRRWWSEMVVVSAAGASRCSSSESEA
eukprot:6624409-Prymnesium_polylepis.1